MERDQVMRILALNVLLLVAPSLSLAEAGGPQVGIVADGAGLFTLEDRAKIEALGRDLLRQQGVTVRVLTMADAEGRSPKAIALKELNQPGLGPRTVLLLILLRPQVVSLHPGTELAPYFEEQASAAICTALIAPQIRAHAYAAGAMAGLTAIRSRLSRPTPAAPSVVAARPAGTPLPAVKIFDPGPWILGLVFCIFPAYFILMRIFGRKCSKCRGRMTSTAHVIDEPTSRTYGSAATVYVCTVCGNVERKIFTVGPLDS